MPIQNQTKPNVIKLEFDFGNMHAAVLIYAFYILNKIDI